MSNEFRDLLDENFDDIMISAKLLGIDITDSNVCQSGRRILINVIHNAREWIIESDDDGKYILSHMNSACNPTKKFRAHVHRSDFISYHMMLEYIESSHNPAKRVINSKNRSSYNLERKLKLVANNR